MNKKLIFLLLLLLTMFLNLVKGQTHTGSWGDQGNGTYINPVLDADYSDPDIIRVDNKYYMICSEFHFMGIPAYVWKKPDIKGGFKITAPQTDDDFNSQTLGLQWQWNHNPVNELWSLTVKPGYLNLKANKSVNFVKAHNTLTQKVMGTTGEAITD